MSSATYRLANRIYQTVWRAFNASKTTPHYPPPTNANLSPDAAVNDASTRLREWGTHFEENHDLAVGILDELVNQTVGRGIVIEPAVVDEVGRPLDAVNQALTNLLEEWGERPDVTNQLNFGELQRLEARAWFRDGETFIHHVQGAARGYNFEPGRIPYAVELVDAARVPLDLTSDRARPRVVQGVEIDSWHRPRGYRVTRESPAGNPVRFSPVATPGFVGDTRRVPAEQMTHIAWRRRYPQIRGVSIFAPVTRRLHDLHDYDESERIAARINSRIAMWVERDPEFNADENDAESGQRQLTLPQGSVLDELLPGEKLGTASTDRPNQNLNDFRAGQLRAVAAGTYTRYSSIARDYNGTYSAQRQELVEAAAAYNPLTAYFISRVVRAKYVRLVETALLSGRLMLPGAIPLDRLTRAEYHGPAIPWIDPKKEVEADALLVNNDFATREQVIRRRGGDPRRVPERETNERTPAPAEEPETDDDNDPQRQLF